MIDKEIEELVRDTINLYVHDITDKIFLTIQNNRKLMDRYIKLLLKTHPDDSVDLRRLNGSIGRHVQSLLNLEFDKECDEPKSSLIRTYSLNKLK